MSRDKLADLPACPRLGRLAGVLCLLMVATLLAGCGKKGNPTPPADEPSTYPQQYPKS